MIRAGICGVFVALAACGPPPASARSPSIVYADEHHADAPATSNASDASSSSSEGTPLSFELDPVMRDPAWRPASEQLRGKRAIVVVVTTWDGGSLQQLRELGPLLQSLPADATCLLVAMQPLGERVIIDTFLSSAIPNTCLHAIGDRSRGRLGDLAKIDVVPATIVLRSDGTAVGAAPGLVEPKLVKEQLEKAK